jgi:hypothetical protein
VARNRNLYQIIERRRWDYIRSMWTAHIPSLSVIGRPPNQTMSEFLLESGFQLGTPRMRTSLPGIHSVAMSEAIFLFQKSIHVASAVEVSTQKGMVSWAIFQGYHSAYYAAKGFLALLGVCFPQPAGRQLVIDLFPIQVGSRGRSIVVDNEIMISNCPMLDQSLLWGFVGRLLRISEFGSDFRKHLDFLENLDHEHIPRPRNRFIYHENHWPYDDLTALREIADFAFRDSFGTDLGDVDEENPLFLAVLGMVLPSLLRLMFEELIGVVPTLGPHILYMDNEAWVGPTQMVRSYF